MTSLRPEKRRKTGPSTFYDAIPILDEYDTIYSSETFLRNIGGQNRCGLRQVSVEEPGLWETLSSWGPPDDNEMGLDESDAAYIEAVDAPIMNKPEVPQVTASKKKRSLVSQRPHVIWKDFHRQMYLDKIIRWSGWGDFMGATCMDCRSRKAGSPEFRCRDCFSPDLTCQTCCVKRHRNHPFHRIERWSGDHFEDVSLRTLGLTIQLNHSSGHCDNPIPCHASMLILDTNGIHSVNLLYCGCTRSIPQHLQLLRRRLYPASQLSVKTCATFSLLKHLHHLALTTKASTYDFYRCLERSTTNIGINVPKSRYRALFRMILQWRHLQMLKWAGRGNDELGAAGTTAGELAVNCLTCPHPGINIPEGWKDVPDDEKFLYRMIICMDANFRLKNQLVSNYSQDPGLGIGWAYMLPRLEYESYVLSRAKDEDVSTCVGFQALAKANTKFSKGLRYTGVGMASCGRSEMVLPLGVGNLQKGERYANMDYIFGSVLKAIAICYVLVSYDIACQWFSNLFKRMQNDWPPEIKPFNAPQLLPAIPKLHEQMHREAEHQVYSFKYIPGVGQTDGECPERIWAPHNILGNATKTQGPGSRQDTLDDHFGFWNWLKYTSTGTALVRKYKRAIEDRNVQTEAHRGLTASLKRRVVRKWEKICEEWEKEAYPKTKKNPYHTPESNLSEALVKERLEAADKEFIDQGGSYPHATTATAFVGMALEIEESQRHLIRRTKASAGSSSQKGETLEEQRTLLRTRIEEWERLLPLYAPGILQYQTDHPDNTSTSENPEDHKLWLPSAIPQPYRNHIAAPVIIEIEGQLRMAQMNDALNSMREILKIKSWMVQFKHKNLRGQRQGTRSRAIIDRVHEKARTAAIKYRACRNAHLALAGPGEWERVYQVLHDSDICGYQDPDHVRVPVGRRGIYEDGHSPQEADAPREEENNLTLFNQERSRRDGTGETRKKLSWIWTGETNRQESDGEENRGSDANDGDHEGEEEESDEEEDEDDVDSENEDSENEDLDENCLNERKKKKADKADTEILRVEWSKSRARQKRSIEEVTLVKEEMRRALVYLEWKADWWRGRREARPGVSSDMAEALVSFSVSQANIQTALADNFRELWKDPLKLSVDEDSDDEDGGSGDEEAVNEDEHTDNV